MRHIDFGLGGFEARACANGRRTLPLTLRAFIADLAGRRLLAGCEMHERFYEIGSLAGLANTGAVLRSVTAVTRGS